MGGNTINEIFWPPSYYIMRDRIPFYLTLIYMHRSQLPIIKRTLIAGVLYAATILLTTVSIQSYLSGHDLSNLLGIRWSAPSPIEWGLYTIGSTAFLYNKRGIEPLSAYYISILTAVGGGWLYEFIPMILNYNFFTFFKVNAVKVFFMEFQVLCLPILLYVLKDYEYKTSKLLIPALFIFTVFSLANPSIMAWFRTNMGYYAYRWYVRLPAIALLSTVIYGIKGEKKQVVACGN